MNSDAALSNTYYRGASPKRLILFTVLLANLLYSTLAFAQIVGTGQLNVERRSHTATLLENGKVLIVGGDNQNGIVSQAEIFDPVSQTSALAAALITTRTDHSATRLSDGRVLVIGGRDQTASLQSTEFYNPLTTSFIAGPAMMRARSGHTATILANDKILVTGGDLFGSAEIYDPTTQSFSLVTGSLITPRKFHSAILLQNGQVMIVGGVNAQDAVLNTAEVFDPASQTFYLPPTDMQTARAFATLKLLSDGKVQIIGGDAELSMEVLDPTDGIFIAKALLPPNADLLGATLSTQSRAALFSPSISQDPLLQGILSDEQLSLLDRADQSITELPERNQALVAGGVNSAGQVLNSAKLVSSSRASVTTDKTDYAPGQIVTITGGGFQPNEQVDIYFHEFPEEYPDVFLSATANQQGNFVVAQFAPQEIDIGRIFTLTAIGKSSNFTAQTAFKDAKGTSTTLASSSNPSTIGQSVTFTATVTETGGGGGTAGALVTLGSVTFREGGNNCSQGTAVATSVALNASGQATATKTFTTNGTLTIRACYSGTGGSTGTGDSNSTLQQVINAPRSTTTAVSLAPSTVVVGQASTVTATVTDTASGTKSFPSGTVTLSSSIGNDAFGGACVLAATPTVGISSCSTTVTPASASLHTISAGFSAMGVHAASSGSAGLIVNKRPITITAEAKAKFYGDADPALTYQITSGSLKSGDTITGALTRAAGENFGTYAISQGTLAISDGNSGNNYDLTFVGALLTINKRPITITADAKTKFYGDADPALTYQITSGSLKSGDTITGALTRVTGENFGTYAISQGTLAISDGNSGNNYDLTFVGALLTINKRPITITADAKTKFYGDADPALTYQITSGSLKSGDTITGALTRAAGENFGTYAISQGTLAISDGNSGNNYDLTFVGALLTINKRPITITADAKTKFYGDADPALTYQITSGSLKSGDTITGALTRAAGENFGTYAISQGTLAISDGNSGNNYDLTFVGALLTINKRPITITADAKTKFYGDADPALTYQITSGSLKSGDTITGALTRAAGENFGTYAISQGTLAISDGNSGNNYDLTFVGALLTINKRPITITADAKSKFYGDADPALTYQITSGSLKSGDTITGALTRAAGENFGTYAISQGTLAISDGNSGNNYDLTFVGALLTINKRPITITADAKTKFYGDADPALTYQITSGSLKSGDTITGALTRAAGENFGTYAISQGTLAISDGNSGNNYDLTFVGALLTINKRPITITADAKTKFYGDADPALTYQITSGSLKSGDTITGALTRAAGENFGTYAISQGTLAISDGNSGNNYDLTFVGALLTINKRPITITADAKTKFYGDADPALTYQITSGSLKSGDTITGALTRAAGENFGTYAISQGTLAISDGNSGNNYDLTFVGALLTINKRPITITADAKSKFYGDADPALTYQITSGSLKSGDTITGALTRAAGENFGTYAISQGTLAISDGNSGNNYDLTFVGALLTINKRPITITADAKTKFYGDADPALTYQITSGSLKSGDTITGALTRAAGENFGTYAISQGTLAISDGNSGNNYDLTFVGALLTINKRPITITADAKTKTYSESDPALSYQITSGSLAFSDTFTGALSRVAGELVGTYAIQQGNLALNSNYILSYIGANLTITTGFAYNGFYSPIGGSVEYGNGGSYANPLKTFKLGSTIPVKFGAIWLKDGAALITGVQTLQAVKYSNATDSDPPIDATPTDAATDGNHFRLTGTDWHFNLSTKGSGFSAGTWLLVATLQDGSKHSVWISIKK